MYNYDYPEEILQVLRERNGLDEDDDSRDEEWNTLSPNEVFEECLEWEGIIGYSYTILELISNIFHIDLMRDATLDSKTELEWKRDFVRGFGQFIAHFRPYHTCGVEAMDMDANEIVTITYHGGGTHTANVGADSATAAMRDILKNID